MTSYVEPPEKVREAQQARGPEFIEWHETRALEDLAELCNHKKWRIQSAGLVNDEYTKGVRTIRAEVLDKVDNTIYLKWSEGQYWYVKNERGCWGLLEDDRKGKQRKVHRG